MSVRSFQRAHARRVVETRRRLTRRGGLVAGLAVSGTMLLASSAQAATYTVTTNGDDPPGGTCTAFQCATLRDALTVVNADSNADTISFAPGVTGAITLTHGVLPITQGDGVTITGPGAGVLSISGNHASQIFDVESASDTPVTISGLTLTAGNSGGDYGGAIGNTASPQHPYLSLVSDVITGNASSNGGGGVYAHGSVLVSGTTISGNTADYDGGGIVDFRNYPIDIVDSTVSGNTVTTPTGKNAEGGGIYSEGELEISGSQITGNSASPGTGGLGFGGGVFGEMETLDVRNSVISGNSAPDFAGGLGAEVYYGGSISGSTVSGNSAPGGYAGGADLYSVNGSRVVVAGSTVENNSALYGGGLVMGTVFGAGFVQNTTISGNHAATRGGGLLTSVYAGSLAVSNSTVADNAAAVGAGVSIGYDKPSESSASNPLTSFDNSTVAGNVASQHAGGIYLHQFHSGSGYQSESVAVNSTIVAGNTAAGAADDLERGGEATTGTVDANYSLIQAPGTVPLASDHTLLGISPQLGPLAGNGGPTETMLPSGTSPVIDQGKSAPELLTDQRGDPRTVDTGIANAPGGDGTDIGAVELPATSVIVPPAPTAGTTLSIKGAGLNLSSRALVVGSQTPVTCAVKTGVLHNCVIEIRSGNTLLGSGEVTSTAGASSLTTKITTTATGARYLKNRPLGAAASAELTASQTAAGSPIVAGNVTYLAGPSITLGLGSRSSKLSSSVVTELNRVAKLLKSVHSYTCTAYTSPGKNSTKLTKTIAGAACTRLKRDGLKGKSRAVGKGTAGAIASNKTKKGQAANRRLTVTFTF